MTAAAGGAVGTVRRDPMAMLPFCGYNMGDYFKHWLAMGKKVTKAPKIFMVNWFRKDENGKFMWPGFRDNSRIIKWMIDRIDGKAAAKETEIGFMPEASALDLSGLDIPKATMDKLLSVNKEDWKKEVGMIEEFYAKFGDKIPAELTEQLNALKKKLGM
jgi:phosphoenolpyruvate carboxykinase (GTP)